MGSEIEQKSKQVLRHPEFISGSIPLENIGKRLHALDILHEIKISAKAVKQVQHDVCIILLISILTFPFFLFTPPALAQEQSQNVRVGISSNNFKSLVYNEISLFGTSEWTLYQKETAKPVIKIQPYNVLKITYSPTGFELSTDGKPFAKGLNGTLAADCPKGLLGVDKLKRAGKQALYHGVLEVTPKNNTQFYLVNTLDLQDYLKGVVPNEMPVRFGLEALKAQAVAARNYVLMPRTRAYKDFDVDDSVASQVYFGANSESPLATQAVEQTQGLVALDGWNLILAQYCSTAGGYTEDYENAFSDRKIFPSKPKTYLKGRPDIFSVGPLNREEEARIFYMSCPDSYDMKSPYYRWTREFDRAELELVLAKTLVAQSNTGFVHPEFKQCDVFGELKEIKVNKRGVSGKVVELEIVTDKGSWKVSKEIVIRRLIQKNGVSLPSANIVFENLYSTDKKLNKIVIYGGGFGHGVGMSQFGAGFMATSLHKNFDKILKRYYTGISISTVPAILSDEEGQKIAQVQFFAPHKKAILVVDNKYQIKEFSGKINNVNVSFPLVTSLIPFNRVSRIDISPYVKQGKNSAVFNFPENEKNKGLRFYIELVEKDECEYNF